MLAVLFYLKHVANANSSLTTLATLRKNRTWRQKNSFAAVFVHFLISILLPIYGVYYGFDCELILNNSNCSIICVFERSITNNISVFLADYEVLNICSTILILCRFHYNAIT